MLVSPVTTLTKDNHAIIFTGTYAFGASGDS